jgi:hypothetical protein
MSLKTQAHQITLAECFNNIDAKRKHDAQTLLSLFCKATHEQPVVWGKDIIGFGSYTYKHHSGSTDNWPLTGFSPRKSKLSIYIMPGFEESEIKELLKHLGNHSLGKSCLYINKLSNVNLAILEQIIVLSVQLMKQRYADN